MARVPARQGEYSSAMNEFGCVCEGKFTAAMKTRWRLQKIDFAHSVTLLKQISYIVYSYFL